MIDCPIRPDDDVAGHGEGLVHLKGRDFAAGPNGQGFAEGISGKIRLVGSSETGVSYDNIHCGGRGTGRPIAGLAPVPTDRPFPGGSCGISA